MSKTIIRVLRVARPHLVNDRDPTVAGFGFHFSLKSHMAKIGTVGRHNLFFINLFLPYNQPLANYIVNVRTLNEKLILATYSHVKYDNI